MCFRVAIIRITEHFVFQGAEGAEAAADPPGPLGRSPVSGFWWVLVGSGGFCWVLGGSWSLKTTPLKSLKFIVKNSVLGSGGCKMERKWTLKMHFFGVLKSYEFIVKNRVWAG